MSDDTKDWSPQYMSGPNKMADAAMAYFNTTDLSAAKIIGFLTDLVPIRSAVDFGTGRGLWLATAMRHGAKDIRGYDIPGTPTDRLHIPADCFTPADLGAPMAFDRRYDLAVSTEVAEHIETERAGQFVANIAATSDLVLFSAAVPYQGGIGHLNENWIEYWNRRFGKHGYQCFDILRTRFWHDGSVRSFYRQNLLVFARGAPAETLVAKGHAPTETPLSMIHPEQYLKVIGNALPHELRRVGPDVTQYYHAVTRDPDEVDADPGRISYGKDPIGWAVILKHFGA